MNQKRAPSSWARDTTARLFWRLQNQRRETTAVALIPSAARQHRQAPVRGCKNVKFLQEHTQSK